MKKALLIIACISGLTLSSKAQISVTMADLESLSKMTYIEFDSAVENKGFDLIMTSHNSRDYRFYQSVGYNQPTYTISRADTSKSIVRVHLITTDKQLFSSFKNDLKIKHYKFLYQQNEKLGRTQMLHYYSNGAYQVSWYSYNLDTDTPWYGIVIWKL